MSSSAVQPLGPSSSWFVCHRANAAAAQRLFLFPYAGAGPAAFTRWSAGLSSHIEGCIVHLPGRGSRHLEPARRALMVLIEELAPVIRPLLDRPFAFFGHSFGALLAFELVRCLQRNHLPQPTALFVSGCRAPHLPDPHPPIHGLPEAEFLKELKNYNGLPAELMSQADAMKILLPIRRADFQAFETYAYDFDLPLGCPIVAFGGSSDLRVSRDELEGWALQTKSSFRSEYFPGDHFFLNTARDSLIASIVAELKQSWPS
jgi:medium-chain acyl-[acyl-carrier-protein] hydrolase